MSRMKVSAAIGACAAVLTSIVVATSAQAATPTVGTSARESAGVVQRTPAAPTGATAQRLSSAAAGVSPGISPAASFTRLPPSTSFTCAAGNLCAEVWDPTTNSWKIFFLYACHRYSLSNWLGAAWYYDNQTGNVLSTFYGQSGNTLTSFRPSAGAHNYGPGWNPVWSIRNC